MVIMMNKYMLLLVNRIYVSTIENCVYYLLFRKKKFRPGSGPKKTEIQVPLLANQNAAFVTINRWGFPRIQSADV